MDFKKLIPWNWFKSEEGETGFDVPVRKKSAISPQRQSSGSLGRLQQEMDRLFEDFFHGCGPRSSWGADMFPSTLTGDLLKPMVDICAGDREYTVSFEIPGVDQEEITLEIVNNTLTVRGEKKQEKEEKEKDYYRMERSYGAFQRVLSLPEDADQDGITATFKNGVLTVTMPKKSLPNSAVKQIDIQ